MLPEYADIIQARRRLKGIVKETPIEHTKSFSALAGKMKKFEVLK